MTRILLTEDDEDVRALVEDVLLDEGYDVDATETVAGAFARLAAHSYDLVLTDGRLPDGTGLEIADKAKQRNIKVVIFTGYAHDFPPDELAQYTVVMKPASMKDLMRTVAQVLNT
jgi:CheY-like chemotaxis protein